MAVVNPLNWQQRSGNLSARPPKRGNILAGVLAESSRTVMSLGKVSVSKPFIHTISGRIPRKTIQNSDRKGKISHFYKKILVNPDIFCKWLQTPQTRSLLVHLLNCFVCLKALPKLIRVQGIKYSDKVVYCRSHIISKLIEKHNSQCYGLWE